MIQHRLERTITGHIDSINALNFSHDGQYFASGADGLI